MGTRGGTPAGTPDGAPAVGSPALPPAPRRIEWRPVTGLAVVTLAIVACGVALLLKLGANIGGTGVAIGAAAAIIPVPFLIAAFVWVDRYEPQPVRYLAFCLLWGAFVATLIALLLNTAASNVFRAIGEPQDLVGIVVAPIVEESAKALGPVLLIVVMAKLKRRTVGGIVDAVVLFGLSAAGFAFSENILYLGGYGYTVYAQHGGVAGGLEGLFGVFIGRVPLSGFAHPLFTSMTAIGVGVAARTNVRGVRIVAPIAGWLAAMALHGSWNLMSVLAADTGHLQILLYGYFSVFVPIFAAVVMFVMYLRSAQGRLTGTVLGRYVAAGWISPPEVGALASVGRRRSARAWAARVAGKQGTDAMRGFQLAATRLALLRDRVDRRVAAGRAEDPRDAAEERRLIELLTEYRAVYAGRDAQGPPAFWDGSHYRIAFPDGTVRLVDPPPTPVVPVPIAGYALPFPAPGYPPSGYPPPGYPPGGYPPPGYAPSGYAPPGYSPSGYPPPGYSPSGYPPPGYPPGGYPPPGYPPPGYPPPGYPPPGYPPPGYPPGGYPPPGYPPPGYPPPG